jgi:general secretion pathway protein H
MGETSVPRRAGFTLLEIILVMLIMAIGMTIVVPAIEGGFTSREVNRAARRLYSIMHHLRGEAVASGRPTLLRINQHDNTIETVGGGRWDALSERAVIESVRGAIAAGEDLWDIRFFPNGSNTGGAVVLANRDDRSRNRFLVTLDPLVGTVEISEAPL